MRIAAAALCATLAACAGAPPDGAIVETHASGADVPGFEVEGRLSVTRGEQSFSGQFRWQHRASLDDLLISTPLGQAVGQITGSPGSYLLTLPDREPRQAATAEALSADALGVPLPIGALAYWITGRSAPSAPHESARGDAGELARLSQQGWHMDFRWREFDGAWRPRTIFLRRGDIDARLVMDAWH